MRNNYGVSLDELYRTFFKSETKKKHQKQDQERQHGQRKNQQKTQLITHFFFIRGSKLPHLVVLTCQEMNSCRGYLRVEGPRTPTNHQAWFFRTKDEKKKPLVVLSISTTWFFDDAVDGSEKIPPGD